MALSGLPFGPLRVPENDVISGERLQAAADICITTRAACLKHLSLDIGTTNRLVFFESGEYGLRVDLDEQVRRVEAARVVFVYGDLLPGFFAEILPRLATPVVLVTHNSDRVVDGTWRPFLDDGRLFHWFAHNTTLTHAKVTPLPIGIANAQWKHGDPNTVAEVAATAPRARDPVAHAAFDPTTNPAARADPDLRALLETPLVRQDTVRPHADYLAAMARCRYAVSPPGNGADCHRHWEALYVGTAPVVLDGPWLDGFRDLPFLAFETWADVTQEALEERLTAHQAAGMAFHKLSARWWRRQIRAAADGLAREGGA